MVIVGNERRYSRDTQETARGEEQIDKTSERREEGAMQQDNQKTTSTYQQITDPYRARNCGMELGFICGSPHTLYSFFNLQDIGQKSNCQLAVSHLELCTSHSSSAVLLKRCKWVSSTLGSEKHWKLIKPSSNGETSSASDLNLSQTKIATFPPCLSVEPSATAVFHGGLRCQEVTEQ